MPGLEEFPQKNRLAFITAMVIMLLIAFVQCYKTTHDLRWAADPDFDRDIAFAQGTLDGHFGEDPNYAGEYLWYNPLLFTVETIIVKITGLPIHDVVTRAGTYLNLLGPIAFVCMLVFLFDFRIAVASLLSYLFLATGNIYGWGAATYSPWLYPVSFMQFIFYLNIILCYQALSKQTFFWFCFLGVGIGVSFLGHTAPTVLIILILIYVQGGYMITSAKKKNYLLTGKYFIRGIAAFTFFVIAAYPLLYYVLVKYHLRIINRATFEYAEGIFVWNNFLGMVKANISISFLVAAAGFVWFYRNFHQRLIRKIIFAWLSIAVLMYIYSTLVAGLHSKFNFNLPGTVPSFHYFFYLKALQSVFFGFGFIALLKPVVMRANNFIKNRTPRTNTKDYINHFYIVAILLCIFFYFPFYKNREDFVSLRQQAIVKQNDKNKMEVYHYIMQNIPSDKVILCEKDPSLFPVMATARKMVSIAFTFSNPYLDFNKRENDRNNMLLFLATGQPEQSKSLFAAYNVNFVLLSTDELKNYKAIPATLGEVVFKNDGYSIFAISR